jgi:uncharacterized protein YcaQ
VHGYYTLPILHRGLLVGRVDAKTHRAEQRLEVRHVHFEPWAAGSQAPPIGGEALDASEILAGVGDALASLAVFVGARTVAVRRVTPHRLRAGLAGAVAKAAAPTPG